MKPDYEFLFIPLPRQLTEPFITECKLRWDIKEQLGVLETELNQRRERYKTYTRPPDKGVRGEYNLFL
jgi:hypothetical protein